MRTRKTSGYSVIFVKLSALSIVLQRDTTLMYVNLSYKHKQQFLVLFSALLISAPTFANPVIPVPVQPQQVIYTPGAPNIQGTGYMLMDATTGKIIAEKSPDERMPPASLTKLMSMYIISGALKNGQVKLDDKVLVSTKAWKTEGSRMFIKAGDEVPVKDLLQGIIVDSGNDATVAWLNTLLVQKKPYFHDESTGENTWHEQQSFHG